MILHRLQLHFFAVWFVNVLKLILVLKQKQPQRNEDLIVNPDLWPFFLQVWREGQKTPGEPRAEDQSGLCWRHRRHVSEFQGPETQGPVVQPKTAGRAVLRAASEEEPESCSQALAAPSLQHSLPSAAAPAPLLPEQRSATGPLSCKPTGLSGRLGHFMWSEAVVVKPISSGGSLAV